MCSTTYILLDDTPRVAARNVRIMPVHRVTLSVFLIFEWHVTTPCLRCIPCVHFIINKLCKKIKKNEGENPNSIIYTVLPEGSWSSGNISYQSPVKNSHHIYLKKDWPRTTSSTRFISRTVSSAAPEKIATAPNSHPNFFPRITHRSLADL